MEQLYILEKESVGGECWVGVATSTNLKKIYAIKSKTQGGTNMLTGNPCKFRLKVAKQIEVVTEFTR
tara:strand:- start:22359 stop:22559 length:201 start_codon:yes stop_codon:yes gene_type:complete